VAALATVRPSFGADIASRPPIRTPAAPGSCVSGKVFYLRTAYNPASRGAPELGQAVADDKQLRLLDLAVNNSPSGVQADLCALDAILILTDGTHSWGKWDSVGSGGSFIGINVADFDDGISGRGNAHLAGLGISGANNWHRETNCCDDHTYALGILATLAHELAHMKFRRDPTPASPIRKSACFKDYFIGSSWGAYEDTLSPTYRRFLSFGLEVGAHKAAGNPVPKARHNGVPATPDEVRRIYTEGFATALGSQSPEEDFVETYTALAVMRWRGSKKSLHLFIPDGLPALEVTVSRRGGTGDPILQGKLDCVSPHVGT
jgi:hypothetical protein